MREPHGPSRQGPCGSRRVFITVNQLEAAQPPALTFLMLQAATTFCQERAYKARGSRGPPEVEGAPREP